MFHKVNPALKRDITKGAYQTRVCVSYESAKRVSRKLLRKIRFISIGNYINLLMKRILRSNFLVTLLADSY